MINIKDKIKEEWKNPKNKRIVIYACVLYLFLVPMVLSWAFYFVPFFNDNLKWVMTSIDPELKTLTRDQAFSLLQFILITMLSGLCIPVYIAYKISRAIAKPISKLLFKVFKCL